MRVECFEKHFDSTTPDHVWLEESAKHDWICLSKDKQIMCSELSVRATIENGARLFICIGVHSHPALAENVIRARHKLGQWAHRVGPGFIARLHMSPPPKGQRKKLAPGQIKAFDHASFLARF